MTTSIANEAAPTRKRGLFPLVLGLIFCLFIGILAASWILAEKIDPVMLDEKGNVRGGGGGASGAGGGGHHN